MADTEHPRHPIQPIVMVGEVKRFKENKIVTALLNTHSKMDLNTIACMNFSTDDQRQLAQLIGYSVSGYGDLSFVSADECAVVDEMAATGVTEEQARIITLEASIKALRDGLRDTVAALYHIHPDDLNVRIEA
jgi:hypothetical protein